MSSTDRQPTLFDVGEPTEPDAKYLRIHRPVWTEQKSELIARYLKHFVYVTHRGTYFDAFTGPQYPDKLHTWAVKLVLENSRRHTKKEPKRLRNFYLWETDPKKFPLLEALAEEHRRDPHLKIVTSDSDSNKGIREILTARPFPDNEAVFALLDQHTFECEWETVKALASYKKPGFYKIELFYFLAIGWLPRAVAATTKNVERIERWWGNRTWTDLLAKPAVQRGEVLAQRFKRELGYKFAQAYPIYKEEQGSQIMYFMVHASDHAEAPKLMNRAYRGIHAPEESWEQVKLLLEEPDQEG